MRFHGQIQPDLPPGPSTRRVRPRRPSAVATWTWFILRNLIGWLLILVSGPIGFALPGPGGLPLFLIGFALITLPGKRHFTARVLKGKPIRRESLAFRRGVALAALFVPAGILGYLWAIKMPWGIRHHGTLLAVLYLLAAPITFGLGLRSDFMLNKVLHFVARIRRRIRPWLRHRGIDLLPPRRRRRHVGTEDVTRDPDTEILEIDPSYGRRFWTVWSSIAPWMRRVVGLGVTAAILAWILKPIVTHWEAVKGRIAETNWLQFLLASAMFALFLFACRALAWRRILIGFGYRLPVAAATRIWSTSELARYIPGVIWQVAGRVYLVRPYGVRGSVSSTSQVLELVIFLLANLLVAVGSLAWLGHKVQGDAGNWLIAAAFLIPLLLLLLHPRILYKIANNALGRFGKPPIDDRMRFGALSTLLVWAVAGLLWQSLAIWLVTHQALHLPLAKWWVVAGAYSLAWCAGFLAFWSPGGLGVREFVFIGAMHFALPPHIRAQFADPRELTAFLAFLSVLLRLWATTGELMLAGLAYLIDYRAALGQAVEPVRKELLITSVKDFN